MAEALEFLLNLGKQHGLLAMMVVLYPGGVTFVSFWMINKIIKIKDAEIKRISNERNELQNILFDMKGIKRLTTKDSIKGKKKK